MFPLLKMKHLAVIIVLTAAISLLVSVESRRVLLSVEATRKGGGVQKGIRSELSSSSGETDQWNNVRYPEGTNTENHYNIPRESFGDWGGDGTNSNKNGSG